MNETTTKTSQQIMFPQDGSYLITITAVNSVGESEHSTAIIITVEIPPEVKIPGFSLYIMGLVSLFAVVSIIRKNR